MPKRRTAASCHVCRQASRRFTLISSAQSLRQEDQRTFGVPSLAVEYRAAQERRRASVPPTSALRSAPPAEDRGFSELALAARERARQAALAVQQGPASARAGSAVEGRRAGQASSPSADAHARQRQAPFGEAAAQSPAAPFFGIRSARGPSPTQLLLSGGVQALVHGLAPARPGIQQSAAGGPAARAVSGARQASSGAAPTAAAGAAGSAATAHRVTSVLGQLLALEREPSTASPPAATGAGASPSPVQAAHCHASSTGPAVLPPRQYAAPVEPARPTVSLPSAAALQLPSQQRGQVGQPHPAQRTEAAAAGTAAEPMDARGRRAHPRGGTVPVDKKAAHDAVSQHLKPLFWAGQLEREAYKEAARTATKLLAADAAAAGGHLGSDELAIRAAAAARAALVAAGVWHLM
jgi:hypothetical protein